jgi:hypothetical protein
VSEIAQQEVHQLQCQNTIEFSVLTTVIQVRSHLVFCQVLLRIP